MNQCVKSNTLKSWLVVLIVCLSVFALGNQTKSDPVVGRWNGRLGMDLGKNDINRLILRKNRTFQYTIEMHHKDGSVFRTLASGSFFYVKNRLILKYKKYSSVVLASDGSVKATSPSKRGDDDFSVLWNGKDRMELRAENWSASWRLTRISKK